MFTVEATASAPGKVILVGEHFVVENEPAVAMAINRRAYVTSSLRDDGAIYIKSLNLKASGFFKGGGFKPEVGGFEAFETLNPIKVAVEQVFKFTDKIVGLNILIDSQIPVGAGLGSSASIFVATVKSVADLLKIKLSKGDVFKAAFEAEKVVHGKPSGIDPAISTYGGIIAFRRGEGFIPIKSKSSITLVLGDSGIRRSTRDLVQKVQKLKNSYPNILNPIYHAAGHLAIQAAQAIRDGEIEKLGELMNINQGLLRAVGASSQELENLIYASLKAGALGAKLTGAGGGGCIIALVKAKDVKNVAKEIRKAGGRAMTIREASKGVSVSYRKLN